MTIECDNAAFTSDVGDDWTRADEVTRIIEGQVLPALASGRDEVTLVDVNGNTVGAATFTED